MTLARCFDYSSRLSLLQKHMLRNMHTEESLRVLHSTGLTLRPGQRLPACINFDGFVRCQPPLRSIVLWGELLPGAERTDQGPEWGKWVRMQEIQSAYVPQKPFWWQVRYGIAKSLAYKSQTDHRRLLVWMWIWSSVESFTGWFLEPVWRKGYCLKQAKS